jgi:CheY-like chemotaxis protein
VGRMEDIDFTKLRFLVIDDLPFTRQLIVRLVEELGVKKVSVAAEGEKGLTTFDDSVESFDLIICDLEMPNMDGFEFVSKLRQKAPNPNADVPVLIVTGHSEPGIDHRAVESGIHGYLMKPVSKQVLEKRIIAALKSPVIDLEKIKEDLEKLKSADDNPEKSKAPGTDDQVY